MSNVWKAPGPIFDLTTEVKERHHMPRLRDAKITVAMHDSKPFKNNRLNWGKTSKFSQFNKIWQGDVLDFCIVLCADVWHSVLDENQREALIDLHLTRCEVEYVPELNEDEKPVKDEFGRTSYTDEIKLDDEGKKKWQVVPLDLIVFSSNVRRYGLWIEEIDNFGHALKRAEEE